MSHDRPFNSSLDRLLDRFLRYVRIDTTAREGTGRYPSSPGQLVLGKLLVDELLAMGVADAAQSVYGIVMGTVPATTDRAVPTIAFNAHVDTSPETTGANVRPQIIRDYAGGDLVLPGDPSRAIRVAENLELTRLVGRTIVTTDGTTLLGADDKSGVAVIMETAQRLVEHPEITHGPIRVLFTCDEEIGHGVDHVDLTKLAAAVCYTLDGSGGGEIDVETFSADLAVVRVGGVNIHPSIAKDRMVNAVRVAGTFLAELPGRGLSPESTDGRQGFLHPYHVEGGVAEVTLRILLRDFVTANLQTLESEVRAAAARAAAAHPGASIEVAVTPQYRNMGDGLTGEPRAVEYARLAYKRLGIEPRLTIVRGGTDGSRFTELGLPTPNLSTGEHNPHSPLEWTCLEEMEQAVEVLVSLAEVWAEREG